jgi:hypothetical protein
MTLSTDAADWLRATPLAKTARLVLVDTVRACW